MLPKERCVKIEVDKESFYLVRIENIENINIYQFDNAKKSIYCTCENGNYKIIDRKTNPNLSNRIKDVFENNETDIAFTNIKN